MSFPPGSQGPAGPQKPEPTLRDRVARIKTLVRRAAGFWKGVFLLLIITFAAAYLSMINTKRTYMAECKIVLKRGFRTGAREEGGDNKATIKDKLKEALKERARLEGAIKKFNLYPTVVNSPRGLLAATTEMRDQIGFRGTESSSYYISFAYPERVEGQTPELVRAVTQYLADTLVSDYTKSDATAKQHQADFDETDLKETQKAFDTANGKLVVFLDTHPNYLKAMQQPSPANGPVIAGGNPKGPNVPLVGLGPAPKNAAEAKWQAIFSKDQEWRRLNGERAAVYSEAAAASPKAPTAPTATAPSNEERDNAAKELSEATAARKSACGHGLAEAHPDYAARQAPCNEANARVSAAVSKSQGVASRIAAAAAAVVEPDTKSMSPELQAKLSAVSSQIAKREAQLKKDPNTAPDIATVEDAGTGVAELPAPVGDPRIADEQEFQRLMQTYKDAKTRVETKQQSYELSRTAAAAAISAASEIMSVVEPALAPTQATKGRGQSFIMVASVGAILALAYAAARVLFNDRIIDQGDLDALGIIPVLGVVPRLPAAEVERGSKKVKVTRAADG